MLYLLELSTINEITRLIVHKASFIHYSKYNETVSPHRQNIQFYDTKQRMFILYQILHLKVVTKNVQTKHALQRSI